MGLFCRDSEESCDSQVSKIEFPSKFVLSLLKEIAETPKTAQLVLFLRKQDMDEKAVTAKKLTMFQTEQP